MRKLKSIHTLLFFKNHESCIFKQTSFFNIRSSIFSKVQCFRKETTKKKTTSIKLEKGGNIDLKKRSKSIVDSFTNRN